MQLSKSAHFYLIAGLLSINAWVLISTSNAQTPDKKSSSLETTPRSLKPVDTTIKEVSEEIQLENISPWLQDIPLKTRRRGILSEEAELYYKVLGFARDVDSKQIKKAAQNFINERWEQSNAKIRPLKKFPIFVDMYQNPQQYQGRPLTITGHIQRSSQSKATANEFGIDTLCEAWLFTEDSQSNPIVIVSTSFPEDFPIGDQTVDHVTVTGYIYRLYTYDARDSRRYAPLLIAHEIKWNPESNAGQEARSIQGLLILLFFILLLGGLLGAVLLNVSRNRTRLRNKASQQLSNFSQPSFDFEEQEE